jgi:hypothetical protein
MDKKLIHNNKIICDYMGWVPFNKFSAIAPGSKDDCWMYEDMKFLESLDWLMPVVYKLTAQGYKYECSMGTKYGDYVSLNKPGFDLTISIYTNTRTPNPDRIKSGVWFKTKREALFQLITEVIEWDNEQKK